MQSAIHHNKRRLGAARAAFKQQSIKRDQWRGAVICRLERASEYINIKREIAKSGDFDAWKRVPPSPRISLSLSLSIQRLASFFSATKQAEISLNYLEVNE